MARLGQILLSKSSSTPPLEEALEDRSFTAGEIGTNLVELGFLKEHNLARVLGKQHNMSFAAGEMQMAGGNVI